MALKAPFPWFDNPGLLSEMEATDFTLAWAIRYALSGIFRIDCDGSIWRCRAKIHGKWKPVAPRRAENVGGKGYLRLTFTVNPKKLVQVMAHRVVWAWFNGPIPDGLQVNHEDLCKQNNNPDNLNVLTGAGNIQHSYANGRARPWSSAKMWRGRARVSEETKQQLRQARKTGLGLKTLSGMHGISLTHVQRICAQGGVE